MRVALVGPVYLYGVCGCTGIVTCKLEFGSYETSRAFYLRA